MTNLTENTTKEKLQNLHNQKDLIDLEIGRKLKVFKLLRQEYEDYDVLRDKLESFHLSEEDQVKLLTGFLEKVSLLLAQA